MAKESSLTVQEKLNLIKQVGEEITTEEELKTLLSSNKPLTAYDGFEPSGRIHIAQGLLRAINVNKMAKAGFKFIMLASDWTAWANHKYGGDLEKIHRAGEYFIEIWKTSGMNLENVEFVWASDLVKTPGYWELLMKIAIKNNLPRILRTVEIMGRKESDTLTASQVLYPLIQTTDIFMLKAQVTQLGMDQRKVNMLAREVGEELELWKPVVVSHHMLLGLLPPDADNPNESTVDRAIRMKMSKSKPESSIFMTDTVEDVKRKIANAWCPEKVIKENPILEYCKYIVFEKSLNMLIKRLEKFGGDVEYKTYQDLEKDYADGKLYPLDLKNALAEYLNTYLQPVRDHFENDKTAKSLKEEVESYSVTR